jgi:HEPN domain-containing protein
MSKQTAVEWLVEQLQAPCRGIPSHIVDQAKEMEKEAIKQAYLSGYFNGSNDTYYNVNHTEVIDAETFYQNTYGNKL